LDETEVRRAACYAYLRHYFHEALATAPVAQAAINLILALYRVERGAADKKIARTPARSPKHTHSPQTTNVLGTFVWGPVAGNRRLVGRSRTCG